jgi:hypothetical protein
MNECTNIWLKPGFFQTKRSHDGITEPVLLSPQESAIKNGKQVLKGNQESTSTNQLHKSALRNDRLSFHSPLNLSSDRSRKSSGGRERHLIQKRKAQFS